MQKWILIFLVLIIFISVYLIFVSIDLEKEQSIPQDVVQLKGEYIDFNDLNIRFIDVGRDTCILLQYKNINVVIASLANEEILDVIQELQNKYYVVTINKLVILNLHEQYSAGIVELVKYFNIQEIFTIDIITKEYVNKDLLKIVKDKNLKIIRLGLFQKLEITENLSLNLVSSYIKTLENYNLILKLTYNNISYILSEDLPDIQEDIIKNEKVINLGNNGEYFQGLNNFLQYFKSKYRIISLGYDDTIEYSSKDVMNNLVNMGVNIYTKDKEGNSSPIESRKDIYINGVKLKEKVAYNILLN